MDVFLAASKPAYRYDPRRPVARPWLFGIATNLIAWRQRSAGRQSRVRSCQRRSRSRHRRPCQHRRCAVDAERGAPRLQDAIAVMNDADRDVLLLFVWEGLGYDDIATALAVPVGTVKSLRISAHGACRRRTPRGVAGNTKRHAHDRRRTL